MDCQCASAVLCWPYEAPGVTGSRAAGPGVQQPVPKAYRKCCPQHSTVRTPAGHWHTGARTLLGDDTSRFLCCSAAARR